MILTRLSGSSLKRSLRRRPVSSSRLRTALCTSFRAFFIFSFIGSGSSGAFVLRRFCAYGQQYMQSGSSRVTYGITFIIFVVNE